MSAVKRRRGEKGVAKKAVAKKGVAIKVKKGKLEKSGLIQDRTGDLQIFSLTLSQLSY